MKNLEQYRVGGTNNRMELAIPPPRTPDGRVYRYSPNEKATPRHFVMGGVQEGFVPTADAQKRMKLAPHSKQTVCPYSGVVAADDEFTHPEDVKAVRKLVEHAAVADVTDAIHNMFQSIGRKFASSKFIKIESKGRPAPKPRPRFARRDLLRELVCDHCGRDYGVYAIGLFCPDCGAPNLRLHFAREIELVSKQVALAGGLEGQQELAYRLMGNAHEDVLTAFEATLKAVYLYGAEKHAEPVKPVRNDFQNIERAQGRFAELGLDPFAGLSPDELAMLSLNIQKRHILGHNLGIMDEKFAEHAANARVGETVHLIGEDIRFFGGLARRVVNFLDDWLVTGKPTDAAVGPVVISAAVPEQKEQRIVPGLSELAVRLGKWIAENSADGQTHHIDIDALEAAFAGVDQGLLEEAVAELSTDGYITTTSTMAHHLPYIRPTLELFSAFDPIAEMGKPVEDSLILIEKVLQQESVDVGALHKETGWSVRRFNPAVGLVISQLDDKSVSREMQPTYPARWFRISAEDRVALKRYAARLTS